MAKDDQDDAQSAENGILERLADFAAAEKDAARRLRNAKRSWKSRTWRAVGRGLRRITWWSVKKFVRLNWRHTIALAPLQVAFVLWVISAGVHPVERAWVTVAGVFLCGLVVPYWFCGLPFPLASTTSTRFVPSTIKSLTRTPRLGRPSIAWVFGGYAIAGVLTVAGAYRGAAPPLPGLWLIWSAAAGWPWWWAWHAKRNPVQLVALEEAAEIDARLEAWVTDGPAHSSVYNLRPITKVIPGQLVPSPTDRVELVKAGAPTVIGWRVDGQFARGKGHASMILTKTEEIAALYDTDIENVAIEKARGSARRFTVSVYTLNPLQLTIPHPGTDKVFNPSTGVASIGIYVDCEECLYRFYRRHSGPTHDLVAGTTEAGKSQFIESLLLIERSVPFIASVVIDPQAGQSLPAFKSMKKGTVHRTAGFGTNIVEGLFILRVVRDEMFARNVALADVGWVDVDEDGTEHEEEGVPGFDPLEGPSSLFKLVCLTIEEAHAVLALPEAVVICEAIGKMARKCGIKLRLITQVPLLDQLGGSSTLRDMVAGGNVIVFRTANALSGAVAFNGNLPVDPKSLPKEWEIEREDGTVENIGTGGLGYAAGPGARNVPFRTYHNGAKLRSMVRAGETTELDLTIPELSGLTLNDALRWFRAVVAGDPFADLPGAAELAELYAEECGLTELIDPPADQAVQRAGRSRNGGRDSADAAIAATAWERIRAYLEKNERGATKQILQVELEGVSRQNIDTALRNWSRKNAVHESAPGWYKLGAAPVVEATQDDTAASAGGGRKTA